MELSTSMQLLAPQWLKTTNMSKTTEGNLDIYVWTSSTSHYIYLYICVCAYACITRYKLYTHLTPVRSVRVFLQLCGCAEAAASPTADTQAVCRSPVGTVLPCPGGVPRHRAPEDTHGADTHSTCLPPLLARRTPSAGAWQLMCFGKETKFA